MSDKHPQSGTEDPVVDPRKTVGGPELGGNKPIGDPGQKQQPVKPKRARKDRV